MQNAATSALERARIMMHARDEAGLDALEAELAQAHDERALSLVRLGRALVPAIVEVWREHGLPLDTNDNSEP